MIRFAPPAYPGGRHCLMCGKITVGAVFPPAVKGDHWVWRVWINGPTGTLDGRAKDETRAKHAALQAFTDFLKEAQLAPELTTN